MAPTPRQSASMDGKLTDLAARTADDPSAQAFVDEVKAAVADGSIWDQVADQPEFDDLIEEHRR